MIYILVPKNDLMKVTFIEHLLEYFEESTGQEVRLYEEGTIPSDLRNKEFLRVTAEEFYNEYSNFRANSDEV